MSIKKIVRQVLSVLLIAVVASSITACSPRSKDEQAKIDEKVAQLKTVQPRDMLILSGAKERGNFVAVVTKVDGDAIYFVTRMGNPLFEKRSLLADVPLVGVCGHLHAPPSFDCAQRFVTEQ